MSELKQEYTSKIVPALMKKGGYKNAFSVPKISKVVVNMGVSNPQDPRARKKVIENVVEQFKVITGQQPQITLARQSIAGFKLREGDPMGVMVTLRGKYMWGFLKKLLSVALPQVKDFRGVSRTAFDGQGNYSLGLSEQIIFPEVDYDLIESIRSLQVTIVTTADTDQEAFDLLEEMGMPFAKAE